MHNVLINFMTNSFKYNYLYCALFHSQDGSIGKIQMSLAVQTLDDCIKPIQSKLNQFALHEIKYKKAYKIYFIFICLLKEQLKFLLMLYFFFHYIKSRGPISQEPFFHQNDHCFVSFQCISPKAHSFQKLLCLYVVVCICPIGVNFYLRGRET